MKRNLANRLAAGGYWALQLGFMCRDGVRLMREHEVPNLVVDLSDTQVLVIGAVNAFNLFCNVNMDNAWMACQVQVPPEPQFRDKLGNPIDREAWMGRQRCEAYKRVAFWPNGNNEAVYTMWTGVDTNGCDPPHIFVTAVVRRVNGVPQVQHAFRTTSLDEAEEAHRQAIQLIRKGKL